VISLKKMEGEVCTWVCCKGHAT